MIGTVAVHQIRALRRQRILAELVGSFVGITVLAGVLGWASHRTIIGVYEESMRLLATRNLAAPPNPFLLKPKLSQLSNVVIYITLIGALVALLLGHLTVAEDDSTGIGRIIFSRAIRRGQYTLGKIVASGGVLAGSMAASFVVSVIALWIVNSSVPATRDLGRLGLFFGLSWLYLMVFTMVGMVTLLATGRRSFGLLSAMGVWLIVTFAIPQFTSGLRPSQSLNPIVDPVSTSQAFFRLTRRARPLSVAEQYKQLSAQILHTGAPESSSAAIGRLTPILVALGLLVVITFAQVARHDFSRSDSGE